MEKISELQETHQNQDAYRQKLIDANKQKSDESSEEINRTQQNPQQQSIDWVRIITDAAMKHPNEVRDFVNEVLPLETKKALLEALKINNAGYGKIAEIILGEGKIKENRNRCEDERDADRIVNDVDGEVWEEAMEYAGRMRTKGMSYAKITDRLWDIYEIDVQPQALPGYIDRYKAHAVQEHPQTSELYTQNESLRKELEIIQKESHTLQKQLMWIKMVAVSLAVGASAFALGKIV